MLKEQTDCFFCACRAALTSFIEQPDTTRLLCYLEGKDLVAVS